MKRILVGVDLSEILSDLVVARAVEVARATRAKVRLLRVVAMPPVPPPGVFIVPQTEAIRTAAERSLEPLVKLVPADIRDGITIEFGEASSAVCNIARDYDADLVVIGAHRHGVLAKVLGTTAARIVNRLDRPVLVVRPVPGEAERAASSDRRLLAGEVLRREHARLDEIYERLVASYRGGDWGDVQAQWSIFEPALRAHLATEETTVFPEFRLVDPAETARLEAEHDQLRNLLGALGVRIDLHSVAAQDIDELIAHLRAHAAHEEERLHVWMDRTKSPASGAHASPPA